MPGPGGLSAPGGVWSQGVPGPGGCLLWGVSAPGVSALGVSALGVSALGGVCSGGVYPSMHLGRHPPPCGQNS